MSSVKVCVCGRSLGLVSRHDLCFVCRDEHQKRKEKQKRIEAKTAKAKAEGKVLVHSCFYGVGPGDPYVVERCACKQIVPLEDGQLMVNRGEAFNFSAEHRSALEYDRQGAIVLSKPFLNPPMSSIGNRIAIERHVEKKHQKRERHENQKEFDLEMLEIAQEVTRRQELTRMKAVVEEDIAWRKAERACKLDVEAELSTQVWTALTVQIPEAEWLASRNEAEGRPGVFVTQEERSSIGRDVGSVWEPDCQPYEDAVEDDVEEPESDESADESEEDATRCEESEDEEIAIAACEGANHNER